MGGPTLIIVDNQGIFLADLFGLLLALPIALFLAFWMSAVKRRAVVVLGAFIGSFLGFLIILAWVGELIFNTVLPGASPGVTFFGALLFNSITGLVGGILADLIVARLTRRDYRRPAPVQE
ncbi:MAG TPA: PTS sucrose transporter subunit IIBC [Ktedonobacteraceae bacterium]|nr:PTS sucrose transporter subunit IIBC [Ktedonobacteraceae bacterium]